MRKDVRVQDDIILAKVVLSHEQKRWCPGAFVLCALVNVAVLLGLKSKTVLVFVFMNKEDAAQKYITAVTLFSNPSCVTLKW